jgi:hypothetical protein
MLFKVANATLELTNDQVDQVLRNRTRPGPNGCIMATISQNEKYASVNLAQFSNVRRRNEQRFPKGKYYLHHLAAKKKHGVRKLRSVYASQNNRDPLQISHLCHRPRCVNPEHLVIERMSDNLKRNGCKDQRIVNLRFRGSTFIFKIPALIRELPDCASPAFFPKLTSKDQRTLRDP